MMESGPGKQESREHGIKGAFGELDRLLRGDLTHAARLERGAIDVDPFRLSLVAVVLSMVYGACMGTFALFSTRTASVLQVLASMIKVPALFFLTLVVTLPSLYVFNALVGSRLTIAAVVRLLVGSLAVIVAVLASLGPIVAFFSVSTTSYPFILLFNVVVFGVSGALGMLFLLQTLHRLTVARRMERADVSARAASESSGQTPDEISPVAVTDLALADQLAQPPGPLDRVDDRALSRHVPARSSGSGSSSSGWSVLRWAGSCDRSWEARACRFPGFAAGSRTFFRPFSVRSRVFSPECRHVSGCEA